MNLNTGKYWSKAWQLVDGCTPVSAGCDNCWSANMAYRFQKPLIAGKALDTGRISFSGNIRINEDRLDLPLKIKKPTVFSLWNDLFHPSVPYEFIYKVFARITAAKQHTFLILTKRPERWYEALSDIGITDECPPENVYFGTSIENQQTADERIPHLLQIPGKKFLSIEPMLREIIIPPEQLKEISQVICGGETSRNARPCHPDWLSSIRDQCHAAGVPFFFKSWGEWALAESGDSMALMDKALTFGHYSLLPVGHKVAGRLLDGRTHDDLVWRPHAKRL